VPRILAWVGASACLAAGTATGTTAQEGPSPSRATAEAAAIPVLEARLDSLLDRIDGLDERVVAEREAYEASTRASLPEPVRREVDGLVIRALPHDIEVAVELFRSTWDESFAPFFGAPPAELGEVELGYYDHRGEWNPRIGEGLSWNHYVEVGNGVIDPRSGARRAVMTALLSRGPVSIADWLGQGWRLNEEQDAAGFDPRSGTLAARRQLAATRSVSNADCLAGEVPACAASLGLSPEGWSPEEVVRAWYDQETLAERFNGIRGFSRRRALDPSVPNDAADFFTYMRGGFRVPADATAEEAQILITAGTGVLYDAAPASAATRLTLFLYAMERGGEGAVDRWVELDREMPLERALESISGLSIDGLVSGWRERLTTHDRSENRRLPVRSALSWVALLGVLSMTSTRWRLGR
jgi:hypothetical protein